MSGIVRENTVAFEDLPIFSQQVLGSLKSYINNVQGSFNRWTGDYWIRYKPDPRDDPAITPCGGNIEIKDKNNKLVLTIRFTMPGLYTCLNDKYTITMVGWPLTGASQLSDFHAVFFQAMHSRHPEFQLTKHSWFNNDGNLKLVLHQQYVGLEEDKNKAFINEHVRALVASFMIACVKDDPIADKQIRRGLNYQLRPMDGAGMARLPAPAPAPQAASGAGDGGMALVPAPAPDAQDVEVRDDPVHDGKVRKIIDKLPDGIFDKLSTISQCQDGLQDIYRVIRETQKKSTHEAKLGGYVLDFLFKTNEIWQDELVAKTGRGIQYVSWCKDTRSLSDQLLATTTLDDVVGKVLFPSTRDYLLTDIVRRTFVSQITKIVMKEQEMIDERDLHELMESSIIQQLEIIKSSIGREGLNPAGAIPAAYMPTITASLSKFVNGVDFWINRDSLRGMTGPYSAPEFKELIPADRFHFAIVVENSSCVAVHVSKFKTQDTVAVFVKAMREEFQRIYTLPAPVTFNAVIRPVNRGYHGGFESVFMHNIQANPGFKLDFDMVNLYVTAVILATLKLMAPALPPQVAAGGAGV